MRILNKSKCVEFKYHNQTMKQKTIKMDTHTTNTLTLFKAMKHAKIMLVENKPEIVVLEATTGYIPIGQFKEIFGVITSLVKEKNITKLIFDKRTLKVFHQPSMEWYFVTWKEEVYDLGLQTHRKILPEDAIFRHSVKIGREKIKAEHPNGKYTLMSIEYAETIDEAIEN